MKKIFSMLFALTALWMIGCSEEEELFVDTTPQLGVTCNTDIQLPSSNATEGTITYQVIYPLSADVIATAESDATWLRPQLSTLGTMGTSPQGLPMLTAKIHYTTTANKGAARTATLTITYAGKHEVALTIRQPASGVVEEAKPSLQLTAASASVEAAAGSVAIEYHLTNPSSGSVTATSSAAWAVVGSTTSGTTEKNSKGETVLTASIPVTYEANTGAARTATINLTYGDLTTSFTLKQAAASGGGGDDPVTPPTPTGKTLVSGWAELPETIEKSGDYYYTWHITDAKYSNGNKARNYSVCYSKDKMCPMWVAAPMHTFYIKGAHGRTDAYKTDPNFDFTQPGKWSGYSRGHMLASNNRHAGVTSSGLVNKQVFYYSNIAPQISNFNSGDWGKVDSAMDAQWESRSDTTYAVYGCYWDKANGKEIVNGTKIPTHYYMVMLRAKKGVQKWVGNCSADELECIAVMMEHKDWTSLPALSTFAMSVADLEKKTGFVYFGNVPNAPKNTFNASDWGL